MQIKINNKTITYQLNHWYTMWEWFKNYIENWLNQWFTYWVLRSKSTRNIVWKWAIKENWFVKYFLSNFK